MEKHPEPQLGTNGDVVGKRLLAFIIDSIFLPISMAILVIPIVVLGSVLGDTLGGNLELLALVVAFPVSIAYVYLLEGIYGYTPGKKVVGLVVVKSDGSKCTIGASILRNLLLIVDQFPFAYIVGLVLIAVTDKNQRVGDFVADTIVVKQR